MVWSMKKYLLDEQIGAARRGKRQNQGFLPQEISARIPAAWFRVIKRSFTIG